MDSVNNTNNNVQKRKKAISIAAFPDISGYKVSVGECHGLVIIIQVMLEVLKLYYDSFGAIPISGVYDNSTYRAIKEFQRINDLEETGIVDMETWNALAEEFNLALSENQ